MMPDTPRGVKQTKSCGETALLELIWPGECKQYARYTDTKDECEPIELFQSNLPG